LNALYFFAGRLDGACAMIVASPYHAPGAKDTTDFLYKFGGGGVILMDNSPDYL
jgi:hypothetical protein